MAQINERVLYKDDPRGPWKQGVLKGQSFGAKRFDVVDAQTGEMHTVVYVKEPDQ